jgi:hypothetical protein
VSFRGELPYDVQCGVVRQLDRLVATLARYLADLPLPDGLHPTRELERDAAARAADSGDGAAHLVVEHNEEKNPERVTVR